MADTVKLVLDDGQELPIAFGDCEDNFDGLPYYSGIVDQWIVYVPTLWPDTNEDPRPMTVEEWEAYEDSSDGKS